MNHSPLIAFVVFILHYYVHITSSAYSIQIHISDLYTEITSTNIFRYNATKASYVSVAVVY